jgi:prepilin-type processing-associated H-X9-DG protein
MLVALLLPAVNRAKEEGRRLTCADNLHQLSIAMKAYESAKKSYPGWTTPINGATVSWCTALLPNLDRSDLYQVATSGGSLGAFLKVFSCPSDPPLNSTQTGVANYIGNGLVLRVGGSGSTTPPLTSDYISSCDGTTNTLLLGENVQSPPTSALTAGAVAKPHNWYDTNVLTNQTFGYPIPYGPTAFAGAYSSQMIANLFSAHSGGSNVAFCDTHVQFLSDAVGLTPATGSSTIMVYQILVTPDGTKLGGEPAADESQW